MNLGFLTGYRIPTITNNGANLITKTDTDMTTSTYMSDPLDVYKINDNPDDVAQPAAQSNRFIPPGAVDNNYQNTSKRHPSKRKYPSEPPKINETTVDGKLAMFPGRDDSFPDALNKLIHPLSCELCKSQMSSLKSAKDHYESKGHDRSLTAWLTKNYIEIGLQPPPVKRTHKRGPVGPNAFRCEPCDLGLTSLTHANQHYAGRKHRLMVRNATKPSGVDNPSVERNTIESLATKERENVPVTGSNSSATQLKTDVNSKTKQSNGKMKDEPKESTATAMLIDATLKCTLCNVSVTSVSQLQMHYDGVKHQKKAKTQSEGADGLPPKPGPGYVSDVANQSSILASFSEESFDAKDWSMYRTPSGSYYCKTCNTTMNGIRLLQQHLQGKKHLKKAANNNESNNNSSNGSNNSSNVQS